MSARSPLVIDSCCCGYKNARRRHDNFVACFLHTSSQTVFYKKPGSRRPHITGHLVNTVTLAWSDPLMSAPRSYFMTHSLRLSINVCWESPNLVLVLIKSKRYTSCARLSTVGKQCVSQGKPTIINSLLMIFSSKNIIPN